MITFLAIIHVIACLGLVTLVLLQDSKGGGVFTSQASSSSVLGAGGATSLAQTMTKAVAVIFAATCISLSILSARSEKSVIDSGPVNVVPLTQEPVTTAVPSNETAPGTLPSAPQPVEQPKN
jgi:preprotein translocase subunit SecG